jgi:ArsR family metal-binding transcriptional regulator
MEILKLLDKSNCRECGEKTCLAFAGAVCRGWRGLDECPRLDPKVVERVTGETQEVQNVRENRHKSLEGLKQKVALRHM